MEPGANMYFELAGRQGVALITDHMTYREDIERKRTADLHSNFFFFQFLGQFFTGERTRG